MARLSHQCLTEIFLVEAGYLKSVPGAGIFSKVDALAISAKSGGICIWIMGRVVFLVRLILLFTKMSFFSLRWRFLANVFHVNTWI